MFRTFKGGIHPPDKKGLTSERGFSNFSIPQKCRIPLQQHIGAPANPVVAVGDIVAEGQVIGEAQGFISANVHASIPGKVIEIIKADTVYQKQNVIVIEADGAFSASASASQADDWNAFTREQLLDRVRAAGIVGMGGAAFPTAVKLSPPPEKKIDFLVINGAECEPYLTVDDQLMRTYPAEIVEGSLIAAKILGISRIYIGIEDNKTAAVKAMKQAAASVKGGAEIIVSSLRTKYPQGAEKQLIYSLTSRRVPHGALPMDVGVVVQNVGTVYAIRDAVLFEKPLFERFVTVSGAMIAQPGNYRVRIGTTINDIINECGGLKGVPSKIVIGGPMFGTAVFSTDVPVVKGTSGILFLSEDETDTSGYKPCVRCGKCVVACPTRLIACDIANAVEHDRLDIAAKHNPHDCILCGACSYVCPSKRPVTHFIKIARQKIKR